MSRATWYVEDLPTPTERTVDGATLVHWSFTPSSPTSTVSPRRDGQKQDQFLQFLLREFLQVVGSSASPRDRWAIDDGAGGRACEEDRTERI
jgi:hypothetical protein